MSHNELIDAIQSIRDEWQIEQRIKSTAEVLQDKAVKSSELALQNLKAESDKLKEDSKREAEVLILEAQTQADVFMQHKEAEIEGIEAEFQKQLAEKKSELEALTTQTQELYNTASGRGQEEGYNAGYADGLKQFTQMIESLSSVGDQILNEREQFLAGQEAFIFKYVRKYAEKILGELPKHTLDHVYTNIKKGLNELSRGNRLKVIVAQEDYDAIKCKEEDFKRLFHPTTQVELVPNLNMARGGCILESETGSVDSSVQNQMLLLNKELFPDE